MVTLWAGRFGLIAVVIAVSWLGMQAIHELGHVAGAWLSGGTVERVVLHPLSISRTDLAENPRPLIVAWAGPITWVALPLIGWALAVIARLPGKHFLQFFAGFCLISNGLYIGLGSFQSIGDAAISSVTVQRSGSFGYSAPLACHLACICGTVWGRVSASLIPLDTPDSGTRNQ
jgi:hypothetical protein